MTLKDCPPKPAEAKPDEAKSGQAGFTLIEVMVALFVFAVGVTSLIVAQTESIKATGSLEERLMAEIVAENQLILAWVDDDTPEIGIVTGTEQQGERTFRWTREIKDSLRPNILQIDISILPEEENSTRVLYSVTSFREKAL